MKIYRLFKKIVCTAWACLSSLRRLFYTLFIGLTVVLQLHSEWGTSFFEQKSLQGSEIEVVPLQVASTITSILRAVVTIVEKFLLIIRGKASLLLHFCRHAPLADQYVVSAVGKGCTWVQLSFDFREILALKRITKSMASLDAGQRLFNFVRYK